MIFEFLSAITVASPPPSPTWKCDGCTPEEKITLAYIQERTNITDKNALATIMGNIKQESDFKPNICEGGARVNYDQCHRGGFGLIQLIFTDLGIILTKWI